ncbi:ATP-binding protein [Aeromonas hydrophila]|uniref:ATP-binding protein n=1 Tax=Aeromonas hydrophila TaxID=644 RepID=UPI003F7AB991
MIETHSFRTQARTVDHLGREQIADCPTAISELWKNSYDAYARNVSLHIFDDLTPIAALFDDGHGMSYEEFIDRWLVVGTESKFHTKKDDVEDRDGLQKRTKQGQKGIGRLSSANLGPLLLIVSKRKNLDFVAALIDWRIFENPYLLLSDIEIPITRFVSPSLLFDLLPGMFERLTDNIWGTAKNPERTKRLKLAWDTFDRVTLENIPTSQKPSDAIANTIINAHFDKKHFEPWSVWNKESEKGTALLVSEINDDLKAQLDSSVPSPANEEVRKQFFATLSAFTDPFVDKKANEENAFDPEFTYGVTVWNTAPNPIIEDERSLINRSLTEEMEHVLSGNIDENGVFRGQIKAFGEWRKLGSEYVIYPPKDFKIPKGPTTYIGQFGLHVATFELIRNNSTLSDEKHSKFAALANNHSGFLVFRNGLRVLPYGRIDNDFFQIETRRSISAGREFWNARRMFGRISISREKNPNLRDKAGREGFIDNTSAKALRTLVVHILRSAAYEYFGSASDLRHELLPSIQEKNEQEKAEQQRKELAKRNAKSFRSRLKKNLPKLSILYEDTSGINSEFKVDNEEDLNYAQELINDLNVKLSELRITGAPAKLGSSEDDYRVFRRFYSTVQERIRIIEMVRSEAIERIKPSRPEAIAQKQLQSLASRIHARLRNWKKSISIIQEAEIKRVETLFEERNKQFHALALPLVEKVKSSQINLDVALRDMEKIHSTLDTENEDTFQPYLESLELMSESINIELIARQGISENINLRDEINRLNQLAQLGITVEILGHELNSNERMIREGIRQIKSSGDVPGTSLVIEGFEALSNQLEFLSPLKISGSQTRRLITGKEILVYLQSFFNVVIRSRNIEIDASSDFLSLQVDDLPSRLLPVFVNLVNNSVYWLVNSDTKEPKIIFSICEGKVVISDNGPGIDEIDQENLFKMFFTRKSIGGRGIGLYLCRVNLMASGHTIYYSKDSKFNILSGANFIIELKGVSFE